MSWDIFLGFITFSIVLIELRWALGDWNEISFDILSKKEDSIECIELYINIFLNILWQTVEYVMYIFVFKYYN